MRSLRDRCTVGVGPARVFCHASSSYSCYEAERGREACAVSQCKGVTSTMAAKPATAYQGLTQVVQNHPASPDDRLWFSGGGSEAPFALKVSEVIEALEANGYKVFLANRVETICAEYEVRAIALEYGEPGFPEHVDKYAPRYLAHNIAEICAAKLAVLELPLDESRRVYPRYSEVDVFIPTKEELERRYLERVI